jgi:hypothetical protein
MIKWEYTAKAGDIVSLFGVGLRVHRRRARHVQFDTHVARTNGAAA